MNPCAIVFFHPWWWLGMAVSLAAAVLSFAGWWATKRRSVQFAVSCEEMARVCELTGTPDAAANMRTAGAAYRRAAWPLRVRSSEESR